MIDHTGIGVSIIEVAAKFYDAALGALGLRRTSVLKNETGIWAIGYGEDFPLFWIDLKHPHSAKYHTGFRAKSREQVDEFYRAGLAAGGTPNGAPGDREHQSTPIYYAAFLLDFDGNNIEAVFRGSGRG